MATVDSGGRSRIQLPPCFRSLLLPSSSLLTQHLEDLHAASWFQSFLLGERDVPSKVTIGSWGEEEGKSMQLVLEKVSISLSLLHLYPF
jgi:hypothetical protein